MSGQGLKTLPSSPHEEPLGLSETDGLHLPDSYIGHEGGLVVRTPRGTTIDFSPREWRGFVPNVKPYHFGDTHDGQNSHLEADEVSLKKYGEPAEVFTVDV